MSQAQIVMHYILGHAEQKQPSEGLFVVSVTEGKARDLINLIERCKEL